MLRRLSLALLLVGRGARGDGGDVPLHVEVADDRPAACADASRFAAMAASIEPRIRATDDVAAPRASVSFRSRPQGGYGAEVVFDAPSGVHTTRTAEGESCENVARALAIVVALQANDAHETAPRLSNSVHSAVPPETRNPSPPRDSTAERASASGLRVLAHDVLLGGGIRSGVVGDRPSPVARLGYGLTLGNERDYGQLRVGILYSSDTTKLVAVRFLAVDLDICPVALGSPRSLSLSACTHGEIGTKNVAARYGGSYEAGTWAAFGPSLALRWRVVSGLIAQLDLSSVWVATPTRFNALGYDFGAELRRTEVPATAIAWGGGLGLGWTFFSDLRGPNR